MRTVLHPALTHLGTVEQQTEGILTQQRHDSSRGRHITCCINPA